MKGQCNYLKISPSLKTTQRRDAVRQGSGVCIA